MIIKEDLYLKKFDGFNMYLDNKDPGISYTLKGSKLFKKWHREPEFMDIMQSEVSPGDVAFDLGANIGYASLHLAKFVGNSGMVYAVEPSPRNFEILTESIKLNGWEDKVQASSIGISDRSGAGQLYLAEASNLNSFKETKYSKHCIDIKVSSIDDFFKERRFPNFIKMDIEGAEVKALAGIDDILRHKNSTIKILMEIHPMYYEANEFSYQLKRMFDHGFKTKYLVSAGTARPDYFTKRGYQPKKIYKSGDYSRGVYLGVSNDHVIESCSNMFEGHEINLPLRSIIKRPFRIFNRRIPSPKLVRSILLERLK